MTPLQIMSLVLAGALQRTDGTAEKLATVLVDALLTEGYEIAWRGPGDDPRKVTR